MRESNQQISEYYGNNRAVKKKDVVIRYTQEQVEESVRCANDILHFFRNYVYIISLDDGKVLFDPYPFQEKLIESCMSNRFNIFTLARQSGKCVTGDTRIKIRNKKTNEVKDISIEDFYQSEKS